MHPKRYKKKRKPYRRNTRRIRLDARNPSFLRLANHLGRNRLMQIERHEKLDVGRYAP